MQIISRRSALPNLPAVEPPPEPAESKQVIDSVEPVTLDEILIVLAGWSEGSEDRWELTEKGGAL